MKRLINILLALSLVVFFGTAQASLGEDTDPTAAQQAALERSGIPIYPGSRYVTGDESAAIVMWYRSADSPDEIIDWYKENLSDWSEITVNGSRVVYQGPKGMDSGELSTKAYIFVRVPTESGVVEDAEITIHVPN